MSAEAEFVSGLIAKPPRDGAPEFVKANLSFKREELIAWLQAKEGDWVNVQVKAARSGKWYAQVDEWKPEQREAKPKAAPATKPTPESLDDEIPF